MPPSKSLANCRAIGITNQRETTVLWERATGAPLANAIVWQDRRTADVCDRLRSDGAAAAGRAQTGLALAPYFSAPKLAWLLDTIPGARARAERGELAFGTIDTWIAWQLSRGRLHVTDPSNASRTLLYDIEHGRWDDELLELFRIPRALLPDVRASSGVFGEASPDLLGAGIPIAGIAGDQQAALFGQGCHGPGMAKNTYGTGCFMLLHTGAERIDSSQGLITTCAASTGAPEFELEGSVFIAGTAVQWLRDGLGVSSRRRGRPRHSPVACPIPRASTSCRHSWGWAPRIGSPKRAAPSSA